jgi:hypothetical protein
MLVPVYDTTPTIYHLNDTLWNGEKGTFTLDHLPLPADKKVIISLYDKDGITKAVSSELVTVGKSSKNVDCNTASPALGFHFSADDALRRCATFNFLASSTVVPPLTVYGFIAGGDVFVRSSTTNETRYGVLVDMPAGIDLVYWVTDSRNQSGGITDRLTVLTSESADCVTDTSPNVRDYVVTEIDPNASKMSMWAIIGAAVGTVVILGGIAGIIVIKKRRSRARYQGVAVAEPYHADDAEEPRRPGWRRSQRISRLPSVAVLAPVRERHDGGIVASPSTAHHLPSPLGHYPPSPITAYPASPTSPYRMPTLPSAAASAEGLGYFAPNSPHVGPSGSDPFLTPSLTPSRRTTAYEVSIDDHSAGPSSHAPSRQPSTPRFIQHTDGGALPPREPEEEQDIVELPPMYVDTRPAPVRAASAAAGPSTSGKSAPPAPIVVSPSTQDEELEKPGMRFPPSPLDNLPPWNGRPNETMAEAVGDAEGSSRRLPQPPS